MLARGFSFMLFPLQLMARVHTSRRDAPGRVSCSASQQGRGLAEWADVQPGMGQSPGKGTLLLPGATKLLSPLTLHKA